jgi:hypothetical protein
MACRPQAARAHVRGGRIGVEVYCSLSAAERPDWYQSAHVRNYIVDPFGPRQSPMICANRPLYGSKGERCRCLDPFATGQCGGGCSLRGSGGRDFLRHHAPALRISRSTAGRYAGQAHCDDALRVKSELPRIGPKLQRCTHVASPGGC